MKNSTILMLVAVLLGGCATSANYQKHMNTWVGADADRLLSKWGQPTNTIQLSNGGKVLEYVKQRQHQTGGKTTKVPETTYQDGTVSGPNNSRGTYSGSSTKYVEKTTPVVTHTTTCITRFTVNAQGKITNASWEGGDCVAKELPQSKTQIAKINIAQIGEEIAAVCSKPEYQAINIKTPCKASLITLEQLSDTDKITPSEKPTFTKMASEVKPLRLKQVTAYRSAGDATGNELANQQDRLIVKREKIDLDIYEGKITWGEFNKARKEISDASHVEFLKITGK